MSNKKLIPVYAPGSTEPEMHTRLNAYDLVNGAGYTWKPGVDTTPAALTPHRGKADGPEPAQRVLNSAGHSVGRQVGENEAESDDADDDAGAADETETPAETEAPKPAATRGRRGGKA